MPKRTREETQAKKPEPKKRRNIVKEEKKTFQTLQKEGNYTEIKKRAKQNPLGLRLADFFTTYEQKGDPEYIHAVLKSYGPYYFFNSSRLSMISRIGIHGNAACIVANKYCRHDYQLPPPPPFPNATALNEVANNIHFIFGSRGLIKGGRYVQTSVPAKMWLPLLRHVSILKQLPLLEWSAEFRSMFFEKVMPASLPIDLINEIIEYMY